MPRTRASVRAAGVAGSRSEESGDQAAADGEAGCAAAAASGATGSACGMSSPGRPIHATTVPMLTASPGPASQRSSVPDVVASTSSSALSVSASNSGSPSATCSPSVFSHAVSRSSPLVCVSAGMRMGVAIYATVSLTAAMMSATCGSTACSRTGAAGAGASFDATRLIGPSR